MKKLVTTDIDKMAGESERSTFLHTERKVIVLRQ